MDRDVNSLTVGLLTSELIDGDGIGSTVNLDNLTLTTLVGATNNEDLIILADRGRASLKERNK